MRMWKKLFDRYDRLVLFDTETTGLEAHKDEIIEFAAVVVELQKGKPQVIQEYDQLVQLSPDGWISPQIQQLTGISNEDVAQWGIPKPQLCRDIAGMMTENTLLIAYNAHFDLSFLYFLLLHDGQPEILRGKDKLDLYTVFRDRRSYPHKLCNAIEAYGLGDQVVNSHRAVDDVLATFAVMEAMLRENNDLHKYINLFGFNPRYGPPSRPIGTVTYKPQYYDYSLPLYKT